MTSFKRTRVYSIWDLGFGNADFGFKIWMVPNFNFFGLVEVKKFSILSS